MKTFTVVSLLLAALLAGCVSSKNGSSPGTQVRMPPCYPIYYPYEERTARIDGVRPVPDYAGWTDVRIAHDIAAIASCGCAGVTVALTPQQLASTDVQKRLEHFAQEASRKKLRTAVLLCGAEGAAKPMRLDAGNLAAFLLQTPAGRLPGALVDRLDRAILFYDSSAIILEMTASETDKVVFTAVTGLHGNAEGNALPVTWAAECGDCTGTSRYEQVWSWRQPRLKGGKMAEEVRKAASDGRSAVLLQSWNCYRDGSFIEENSLDGRTMMDALAGVLKDGKGKK